MQFIFDFDGVLLDSLGEVIITSYNAASGDLAFEPEKPPAAFSELLRLNRFYCGRAGDFVTLASALLEGRVPAKAPYFSKAEFDEIIAADKLSREDRLNQFFMTRKFMIAGDRFAWLALHNTYEPLWERAKSFADELILMTNKNTQAVVETCEHFGLELREENIYSGDAGATKTENFTKIKKRFDDKQRYFFVDDSVKNLQKLERDFPKEITLSLASWGYLGPEDLSIAKEAGFLIDSQESLLERL